MQRVRGPRSTRVATERTVVEEGWGGAVGTEVWTSQVPDSRERGVPRRYPELPNCLVLHLFMSTAPTSHRPGPSCNRRHRTSNKRVGNPRYCHHCGSQRRVPPGRVPLQTRPESGENRGKMYSSDGRKVRRRRGSCRQPPHNGSFESRCQTHPLRTPVQKRLWWLRTKGRDVWKRTRGGPGH